MSSLKNVEFSHIAQAPNKFIIVDANGVDWRPPFNPHSLTHFRRPFCMCSTIIKWPL